MLATSCLRSWSWRFSWAPLTEHTFTKLLYSCTRVINRNTHSLGMKKLPNNFIHCNWKVAPPPQTVTMQQLANGKLISNFDNCFSHSLKETCQTSDGCSFSNVRIFQLFFVCVKNDSKVNIFGFLNCWSDKNMTFKDVSKKWKQAFFTTLTFYRQKFRK